MGIAKKIAGGIFILLGLVLLLLSFVGDFSIGIFVAAVLCLLAAAAFFKKPRAIKVSEATEYIESVPVQADEAVERESHAAAPDRAITPGEAHERSYSFKVAGISFRQKYLEEILLENDEYDMSKSELIDLGMIDEPIYKYTDIIGDVTLMPEADNEYDPNAIKVCIGDVHVGYVPSEKTKRVRKILDAENLSLSCDVVGGPYKIIREDYDDDRDKEVYYLEKNNLNIGLEVTLRY